MSGGSPRYTCLGSGVLLPDDARHSAAHLVEVGAVRLLMDCGAGTLHGFDRHGVAWDALTHVALTHFHADHVGDLAALLFALQHGVRPERDAPLEILGPRGTRRFFDALADAHGDWVRERTFEVAVHELAPGGRTVLGEGVELRCHATPHTDASLAYRVETDDGTVGYTGDTGPSAEVAAFLAGSDLLVAECSHPDEASFENHLTPASVAEMARIVDPRLLLLTHVYPTLPLDAVVERVRAAGYSGEAALARDGLAVEVGRGRARLV
ncbi:MAG: ribonuclease Z [Gemmatimonadetes bacterium]|nr:ribonuclease Z [Gemmatimonadota bacterium]